MFNISIKFEKQHMYATLKYLRLHCVYSYKVIVRELYQII